MLNSFESYLRITIGISHIGVMLCSSSIRQCHFRKKNDVMLEQGCHGHGKVMEFLEFWNFLEFLEKLRRVMEKSWNFTIGAKSQYIGHGILWYGHGRVVEKSWNFLVKNSWQPCGNKLWFDNHLTVMNFSCNHFGHTFLQPYNRYGGHPSFLVHFEPWGL